MRLERARRYDEALAAYWRAVELDPLNMVLRLCVGQLQERIGLYLDALATYWGMDVTSPPPKPWNRLRGTPGTPGAPAGTAVRPLPPQRVARRSRAGQAMGATPEADENRRDAQRRQLRACLRPLLQKKLEAFEDSGRVRRALVEAERIDAGALPRVAHAVRRLRAA